VPLFQYFGWVGSFLLAALFAANWCCSAPIARAPLSDVPLDQKIHIRIHTDHKWPERVVLDTTRTTLAHDAKAIDEFIGHFADALSKTRKQRKDIESCAAVGDLPQPNLQQF